LATELQSPTEESVSSNQISFSQLIELLESQGEQPSLIEIRSWLENVRISSSDLEPYLGFKEGNYCRHRVCRNDFIEMLVLCWQPGHRTPIHDHNGSHGAVRVHEGVLWETIFDYDDERGLCYRTARECGTGVVTGAEVPDIHQLGNPDVSERNLVTIHVYSPPLGVLRTYKAGSRQIDHYFPNDSDL
jgi:cysteine dioxygenase